MRVERQVLSRRRTRAAFTIVEVLVALVLVTVGLLGVAGNGAVAIRVAGAAARERRATQRAADRLAVLTSQGCAAARSGTFADASAASGAVVERWTVSGAVNGVVLVDAESRWAAPEGARSVVLRGAILC